MKSTFFSLICLVSILFILTGKQSQAQQEISLSDIWINYKFYPASINEIKSMNDGAGYTVLDKNRIVRYSYKTGKEERVLVQGSELEYDDQGINIEGYTFSSDEQQVLIETESESIYRHSTKGNFYIYNLKDKTIKRIPGEANVRLAEFSPSGKQVAYVRENNLYLFDIATSSETQITKDGEFNKIINGSTDWVYEEEFGFTKGFFWSPDGAYIAYYRMDESQVKEFTLTYHGELYPELYTYKYPKAGEDNSLVDIYVYNVKDNNSRKMDVGSETDQYIPRIMWTNSPGKLSIQRLNRLQNHLDLLIADAESGASKVLYSEENKYYVDITDNWYFLKDGKRCVFSSERDGYHHLYMLDMDNGNVKAITSGNWDILSVAGVDEIKGIIYYISFEDGAMNKMLYAINLDGSNKVKITPKAGTHDVKFSSNYEYFIDEFSDANTPPIYTICNAKGKVLLTLEDNAAIAQLMKEFNFQPMEFFTLPNEEGTLLNAWMIKPANMEAGKKYPVLMYVYGGPGVNTVENSYGYFDFAWFQMLAQKGYIVVSVDNRGTGGRGETFKKCTYMQLGNLETLDQIAAAKYLGSLDYIDKTRIGMFGWSYGGFMTTLCMTRGADYFKAGIAVAPVTNWRYYDNIYTERFMRTPQENPKGYDNNSPITHVKKLKGKYLLVHGTTDDNVHVQNSMDLISALVASNRDFEMFFYPNKNHGIFGGYTRYHLYNKMTNFILENL